MWYFCACRSLSSVYACVQKHRIQIMTSLPNWSGIKGYIMQDVLQKRKLTKLCMWVKCMLNTTNYPAWALWNLRVEVNKNHVCFLSGWGQIVKDFAISKFIWWSIVGLIFINSFHHGGEGFGGLNSKIMTFDLPTLLCDLEQGELVNVFEKKILRIFSLIWEKNPTHIPRKYVGGERIFCNQF